MPPQTVLLAGATGIPGARIAHNDRYPDIRPTAFAHQPAMGVGA